MFYDYFNQNKQNINSIYIFTFKNNLIINFSYSKTNLIKIRYLKYKMRSTSKLIKFFYVIPL